VAGSATADDIGVHAEPYAGVATRAVALAFDVIVAQLIALIVFGILALVGTLVDVQFDTAEKVVVAGGWALTNLAYFVLFWTMTGQTPGMQLMRIRVVTAAGRTPGLVRAVVRVIALGWCIVPLFLGFAPVLFDRRRRGLHDMLAGTVVLYSEPV